LTSAANGPLTAAARSPAAEGASLGVGRTLAEAREAQGLQIADIAQQLKFMPRQIESLEAERFDALPGPTIARGMVRTYARFLKLDPEPLLARMSGRVDAPDATPYLAARFNQPVPFSDNGRRSTVVYLALSAAVLAIAGGVVYEWRHERAAPQSVTAAGAPAETPQPQEESREAPEETARVPVAEAQPPKAAAQAPKAAVQPPKAATQPPKAVAQPAAPQVGDSPARPAAPPVLAAKEAGAPKTVRDKEKDNGATPLKTAGSNRLVLRFDQDAWAEVTDAAGRQLVSSLNPAGTERVVRGIPPYNIVIGNAQHVKVSYNNREVDLLPYVKVEVARFTLK
jgi:cytoskeleton protein RodZ